MVEMRTSGTQANENSIKLVRNYPLVEWQLGDPDHDGVRKP